MSERWYADEKEAEAVGKEALWLAWQAAGGPHGMGVLRDRPTATKEEVWKNAKGAEDYPVNLRQDTNHIYADYVFGRMLKFGFKIQGPLLIITDGLEPRIDYQSWSGKYKTFAALFDAAEQACSVVAKEAGKK